MNHDLSSSLDSLVSSPPRALMVRDPTGRYRPAKADEVLAAAQQLLASQLRGTEALSSPAMVRNFLRTRMGALMHEVFAIVHLDSQNQVLDYVELFRGTLNQTAVYPREVMKDALARNSAAVILAHCHPSGLAEPSMADVHLTDRIKTALAFVDIVVLDHLIVAGDRIYSFAEKGRL